jgi:glycine cleavage system H lipoate-binding protein/ABC-type phosphate transport system substrate-binding protein
LKNVLTNAFKFFQAIINQRDMKKIITSFLGIIMLGFLCLGSSKTETGEKFSTENAITVFCSPDLMKLANSWAEEYGRQNPESEIKILDIQGGNLAVALNTGTSIGLVSKGYMEENENASLWQDVIGREVIVGLMSQKNPMMDEINRQGICAAKLATVCANAGMESWNTLIENGQNLPVSILVTVDGSVQSLLGQFLNKEQSSLKVTIAGNAGALVTMLKSNPNAIGFCRLADVMDPSMQGLAGEIRLLPIDKNGNGRMDSFENIYGDLNAFSRGVWIGKYPQELISGIYSVASEKPKTAAERAFLKWVLTDGQQYLNAGGFTYLAVAERQSKLEKLNEDQVIPEITESKYAGFKAVIIFLLVAVVAGFIIEAIILYRRFSHEEAPAVSAIHAASFNENSVRVPGGLFYDKTHTWAFMERDGLVKIGIDDFLPHVTGGLTSLRMKNPGDTIKKGGAILTIIRNGKQLTVKSPVSGTISSHNKALLNNASLLNSSPYSEGWVYMVEPTNWLREIQFMFMADKFKTWLKAEFNRLKDFVAFLQKTHEPQYAHVILQDGGEVREGILQDLGPEAWEDFQSRFMETTA